jgi:hypothetical protein
MRLLSLYLRPLTLATKGVTYSYKFSGHVVLARGLVWIPDACLPVFILAVDSELHRL